MGCSSDDSGHPEPVLDIPFDKICDAPISLANAPQCHFRFLDCGKFARREALRVVQFSEIPAGQYSTISYVWRGLKPRENDGFPKARMSIDGAADANGISVEVLRIACLASLRLECEYLWLDGLCIIQSDDEDKAWQIQHMYSIYSKCKDCIVIPSGLLRLATLFDETDWIHRAWTLQEAIAPPSAHCLFRWVDGDYVLQSHFPVKIQEIEPETAAIADMKFLLMMSMVGRCHMQKFDKDWKKLLSDEVLLKNITILGDKGWQWSAMAALIGALDLKGKEGMANAVWRSSFMRSAKYSVDMVFSLMGLMGVTLDTTKFGEGDRLKATIALMQAMLKQGHRAEWLGIATHLDNNPELSTIPVFPKPSPLGRAVVPTKEDGDRQVSLVMDGWWMIRDTPKGSMDETGYHTFDAVGASVARASCEKSGSTFESVEGQIWEILPEFEGDYCAILIGKKEQYTNATLGMMKDPNDHVLMIVDKFAGAKFRCLEYAFVSKETIEGKAWSEREFIVGGRAAERP